LGRTKRALDVVVSAALILILSPVLLLIAGLIMVTTNGPALFQQRRGGLGGRAFLIRKFRTMTTAEDGDQVQQATRGDPRVTVIGRFLRRSSLDELPQLFNVLAGDMSMVGPRPHALAHDLRFGAICPRYSERFAARPGITGLAQVRGHRGQIDRDEDLCDRVDCDLEYIATWSLGLELAILLKTGVVAAACNAN
jgi:putative colanic acid biosynthesis UDP-glucose lipid carrier transferase